MNEPKNSFSGLSKPELLQLLEEDFNNVFTKTFENDSELWKTFVEDCLQMEIAENREMETAGRIFSLIEQHKSKELSKILGYPASAPNYFMFLRNRAYEELKSKNLV
jgi:hypothetical protein